MDAPFYQVMNNLFGRLDPLWDKACSEMLQALVAANQEGHVCLALSAHQARHLRARSVVGEPGAFTPLILDAAIGLYFASHWYDEHRLAQAFSQRARQPRSVDSARLRPVLERLFPARPDGLPDRQKLAAALATRQQLLVISGGPGTGKTTTVVRLLALLAELSDKPLAMAMAAPTGKAAARLSDAIRSAIAHLPLDDRLKATLPQTAETLHRLLGLSPGRASARFNRDQPLALDVLVIDEASMVDLALMAKTVEALPPHARLIVLGDHDQLASVEAGSVLSALCQDSRFRPETLSWLQSLGLVLPELALASTPQDEKLADAIVFLTESHRFSSRSGIGYLSRAVNAGQSEEAMQALCAGSFADLSAEAELDHAALLARRLPFWQAMQSDDQLSQVMAAFVAFMPLVLERRQLEAVNQWHEAELERQGLKMPEQPWYVGRPVMITANDYGVNLFNGDIGFTVRRESGLKVAFPCGDGHWREVSPARLPAHETVYAMTVHKSQGSEFDEVWLLLPPDPTPMLDRSLVYTALSRARQRFAAFGNMAVLRAAIDTLPTRFSGLRQQIHST